MPVNNDLAKRLGAELLGTFWLVLGGAGSAVLAAGIPGLGIGYVGVSIAFGLTVLTGAYAFGHVSGAHFNPAVSVGLVIAGKFNVKDLAPYVIVQVIGAILAALLIRYVASGLPGYEDGSLASNGYGELSPHQYTLLSGLAIEIVLTAFFLLVILGSTSARAPAGFAPIAIGLALTLIHLISIPVTNTSVNPARSTGPALVAGGAYIGQLWLFWVAPIAGAAIGGLIHRWLGSDKSA